MGQMWEPDAHDLSDEEEERVPAGSIYRLVTLDTPFSHLSQRL